MNRYKRKKSATSEEKDRKPNPYWSPADENEHGMIEDNYDEDSGLDSIPEDCQIFDTKNRRNSENW